MRRVTLLTAFVLCFAARAQTSLDTPQTHAELIADRGAVAAGEGVWVGLALTMKPGWHTYWRTPGDSGLPARIDWKLPAGVTAGPLQWPPPERVATGDLMNFGYEGEVIVLARLDATAPVVEGAIVADASWLVCADVCIPEDAHFVLPLKGDSAADRPDAARIARARALIPASPSWPVAARRDGGEIVIAAGPGVPANIKAAAFFPDGEEAIENAAPQVFNRAADRLTLRLKPGLTPQQTASGVLVLEAGDGTRQGFEIAAPIGVASNAADMSLFLAIVFAFVGGLILNIMPCVLPVLVMKAMAMLQRRDDPVGLRRDALIYTAGVVTAFSGLVAVLLGLRVAGSAVGWGFQLQSPAIVAVLAYVMMALGLSQSGVFTIGSGAMGVGQSLTGGRWGSFFTGVLAVVVATPCTAPFMGAALGFALTQPPVAAVAVFEGLALGLAFPYVAIAFVPALARLLPRPGVWMERVKQVLAFALYGAAAWLVWVLSQQVAAPALAAAFAGLIALAFAAWSWGLATTQSPIDRRWGVAAIIAAILAGAAVAALAESAAPTSPAAEQAGAESFNAAKLAELRARGRPVLVNFTAAWCITCLLNERVALSRPEVVAAMKANGVAYLKADWTNRNAEITAALHEMDRDGVPVYALYLPGKPPRLLPQVLTPGLVIAALNGR